MSEPAICRLASRFENIGTSCVWGLFPITQYWFTQWPDRNQWSCILWVFFSCIHYISVWIGTNRETGFAGCSSLPSVTFPENYTEWEKSLLLTVPTYHLFRSLPFSWGLVSEFSWIVPICRRLHCYSQIRVVGDGAFSGCSSLFSVQSTSPTSYEWSNMFSCTVHSWSHVVCARGVASQPIVRMNIGMDSRP